MIMFELPHINNKFIFDESCKDLWKNLLKDYTVEIYGTKS